MVRYGVSRFFEIDREAQEWAKSQRDSGYGVRVNEVAGGYMVRRTDRPLK